MSHHVIRRPMFLRRMRGFDLLAYLQDEEPQIFPAGYFDDADPAFGYTEHYYKETIIDELELAELGEQGDVVCHLPLWETAGTQAIDVSMYENHADFEGGVKLGEPPLVKGFVYSVETTDRNQGVILTDSGIDIATDSFTIAGTITPSDVDAESTNVAAGFGDATDNRIVVAFRDSPDLDWRLQAYDGTTAAVVEESTGTAANDKKQSYCARFRQSDTTMSLWIDGTHVGDADFSGVTLTSTTRLVWPDDLGTLRNARGHHQPRLLTSTALSDSLCATLSDPELA